jgi:hypothetical protein
MRSALGVRFLALLVAAAALLPACKKEGDTIIVSGLPPEVKEIFVGIRKSHTLDQILSVTPEGVTRLFCDDYSTTFENPLTGLTWHPGENRLYSCVSPDSSDDTRAGRIFVHAPDGTRTEFASNAPGGGALYAWCLAVSPVDGKLYCGTDGGLIIRWDEPNTGTVVHNGSTPIVGLTITRGGDIFYSTGWSGKVRKVTSPTGYDTWLTLSGAVNLLGLAHDDVGRIYCTDLQNNRVLRLFSPSANEVFLSSSWVTRPTSIAVDAQGNVWVAESDLTLKAFDPNGFRLVPYPIASGLGEVLSIALRH